MSLLTRLFSRRQTPTVLPPDTCVVCLDAVRCPLIYPCGHGACAHCTFTWMVPKRAATCPTCRAPVTGFMPNRMTVWPDPIPFEDQFAIAALHAFFHTSAHSNPLVIATVDFVERVRELIAFSVEEVQDTSNPELHKLFGAFDTYEEELKTAVAVILDRAHEQFEEKMKATEAGRARYQSYQDWVASQ